MLSAIRVWWLRFIDVVLRRRRDDRLTDEISAHLEHLVEENIARGMSPDEARFAARRAFGGVDQIKSRYRDQRGFPSLETIWQDVRFAFRIFGRDRAFALTAVLVLGIGIGVNNMFFMIVYAHALRSLPIADVGRVMYVSTFDEHTSDRGISLADFTDVRDLQRSFSDLAAFAGSPIALGDEGRAPERFDATYVTANAFAVIGVKPMMGRDLSPGDEFADAAPVVLLGESAWRRRYAGDQSIVGRTVLINGKHATVVGVMRDRSGFPSGANVWLPLPQMPGLDKRRDARSLRAIGRLRDGVAASDARSELQTIVDRLAQEYPQTNAGTRARVIPINERYVQRLVGPWLAFVSAGLLIVIISCANVANLMLSRALHRAREIAIRTSLGASRPRVIRQLLMEGVTLAALGGIAGLGISAAGIRLFTSAIPANTLPYWNDYYMDARVFASLVVVSLATVLIFGVIPSIQASRTDVNRVLKDGGRSGSASRGARAWTTAFLAAELAIAIVLLGQLGLSVRTIRSPLPSDLAVNTTDLLTASVTLPSDRYSPEQRMALYRALDERLRGTDGIESMSMASHLPRAGGVEQQLELDGRTRAAGEKAPSVWTVAIGEHYFDALGQPLLRGRGLTNTDGSTGQLNALVNDRFVSLFLSDHDPIGARISVTAGTHINACAVVLDRRRRARYPPAQ